MSHTISGGVSKFCVPDDTHPDPVQRLAALASVNVLWARDIVTKAQSFLAGEKWREQWVEMLESIGIDVEDVEDEWGEMADNINHAKVRKIQTKLEERNRRILTVRGELVEDVVEFTDDTETTAKRKTLFGHPATAVVRWMGADGWSFKEALAAINHLDIDIAEATIKTQLRSGAKGKRGEPAPITEDQADQLYEAAESQGQ